MKNIKILGSGDADCIKLERLTVQAATELGLEYALEKVTSINSILSYGVIMSPGLVIDDEVKLAGRVPSIDNIKELLTEPPASERVMGEGFRESEMPKNSLPL